MAEIRELGLRITVYSRKDLYQLVQRVIASTMSLVFVKHIEGYGQHETFDVKICGDIASLTGMIDWVGRNLKD
jgi:hypothetical protein